MTNVAQSDLLKAGDIGGEVKQLQAALNHVLHDLPALKVDGKFGAKTGTSVRTYQARQRLHIDGKAGRVTLISLGLQRPTSMERQWLLDHRAQTGLMAKVNGLEKLIERGRVAFKALDLKLGRRTVVGAGFLVGVLLVILATA